MLEYNDFELNEDWLYEEENPKTINKAFNNQEKQIPPEWTKKGCETVDDPEAKERLRRELEKKQKEKQNNQSRSEKMEAYWAERRVNGETAKKKADKPKKEQPKMTFADVAEELKQMEEPVIVSAPVPDREEHEVVAEEITAEPMPDEISLALTASEAESLCLFIKNELLTVVKRGDVDELDWLCDMCSIYNGLRKVLIKNG